MPPLLFLFFVVVGRRRGGYCKYSDKSEAEVSYHSNTNCTIPLEQYQASISNNLPFESLKVNFCSNSDCSSLALVDLQDIVRLASS